jgi:hypothetical protein
VSGLVALAATLGLVALAGGCAPAMRIVAPSDDYAEYRRVRLAETMGARLHSAEAYLEGRPRGAFAAEVRALFERDEPRFYEAAQASRAGTIDYLAALPDGPHAAAAIALLAAWDARIEEGETSTLLREARRTEAALGAAALQRREVGEAIFRALRALADPAVFGVSLEETPPALRHFLTGGEGPTWGKMPDHATRDLFFVVPTRLERESRLATLTLSLRVEGGVVRAGRVSGPDLFVHWLEADTMTPLDPTDAAHRARAARHAKERLEGFFEALLPAERCAVNGDPREVLLMRECDGFTLSVTPGARGGEDDVVTLVRGGARSW